MMADFGSDFRGVSDIDANWTFGSGDSSAQAPNSVTVITEALARRLLTPAGSLWYDANYGYDVRELVSSTKTPEATAARVEAECRKDERVDSCDCTIVVTGNGPDKKWVITVNPKTSTGDVFAFVINVSALNVTILTTGNGPINLE
jgi:hypothetical protein